MPYPDPGEFYSDMVQQIFGSYSVPSGPSSCSPAMSGFAWNYSVQPWSISGPGWPSVPPVPANIMQYYSQQTMPVTYFLASKFAACDSWFAAAPVQTIANRVLTHCGTPSKVLGGANLSRVNNEPDYVEDLEIKWVSDPTIFALLDTKYASPPGGPLNWTVYYGDAPISLICTYVYNHNDGYHVTPYIGDFAYDVKNNKLAKYAFIEPTYSNKFFGTANSNHPGGATLAGDPNGESGPPPIDVRDGERLLCDVYSALLANPDLFKKTLLIVTYDEHGGLFDHLGPPCATSPFNPPVQNFNYDRYGVRVPTLLINPYITPGTVYPPRQPYVPVSKPYFDHTSILRTLIKQFELGDNFLSKRVESAAEITGIISATYTQPQPCPAVPAAAPSPPAVKVSARPAHSLAGVLHPLYRIMEQSKRGPRS
jgi:phospholipase C